MTKYWFEITAITFKKDIWDFGYTLAIEKELKSQSEDIKKSHKEVETVNFTKTLTY